MDNLRIPVTATAKPGQTKTGWVGQKRAVLFVLGPKQAILFGPARPKLDTDQKIHVRSSVINFSALITDLAIQSNNQPRGLCRTQE